MKIDDRLSVSKVEKAHKVLHNAHLSFLNVSAVEGDQRDNDKLKAMMLLFEAAAADMRGVLMPMFNKRLMNMTTSKWESYSFPSIPTDVATTMFWIRVLLEDATIRQDRPQLKEFNHTWMNYDDGAIEALKPIKDWQETAYELRFASDDMMEFYILPLKRTIQASKRS